MERNKYSLKVLVNSLRAIGLCLLSLGLSYQASAQMSGNYTIDKNSAASSSNFQSFTSAVQALRGQSRSDGGPSLGGGVNGAVVISVVQGSGPYQEQLVIPSISGSSSSNTITFKGNGEMIRYSNSSSNTAVIKIDGADYLRFDDLVVKTLHSTYCRGFWILNDANYNIIENCEMDITSSTSTSSGYSAGIAMVGSATSITSYSTGGIKGKNNTFRNNEIYGSSTNNGLYAGIVMNGYSNSYTDYNTLVEGNYIHNYYVYGIYNYYYHWGVTYRNNRITRGSKSTITTFYGIYNYYSTDVVFEGNYIHDDAPTSSTYTFTGYGIYDYQGSSSNARKRTYINNIIIFTNGYYLRPIYSLYYAQEKKFYHNTIYVKPANGSLSYAYGIYSYQYTYDDVKYYNNIVDIDFNSGSGTTYDIYSYSYGDQYFDNNVLPKDPNKSNHYTGYIYSGTKGGGAAITWSDWQNNPNSPDPNGTNLRPTYVDAANGNFEPTMIDLDGFGTPVGVTTDFNGDPRSLTNPDPGAIEFDIPINVSAINFPTTICQGSSDAVEVTITNNSSLNLSNFYVNYEIDGKLIASEQITSTINSGSSGTFTFNTEVVSDITGSYTLEAYVRGKMPVVSHGYTVNPAPVGSYVSQGSPFIGAFNSGDGQDPDIVAYGDNIRYSIEPPTGYTNNDFNASWDFDFWELVTPNGTSAGGTHNKTNPTGGNNAVSSFIPVMGQSDSTFLLRYAIHSLSNGCVAPVVERQVFVAPRPVAAFAANTVCEGDAMSFDNNTSISSGSVDYLWRFGDGDSTVLINPDHVYPAAGTYTVDLVAISNYGYMDVETMTVSINENPTAEFGASNVCDGDMTPFTDGSIIPAGTPTYEWDFGDGSALGSGPNPTHQYATTGVYEVTMRVTANGCTGEVSNYVTYAPRASVDFTPSVVDCNNKPVSFANNSSLSSGQMGYSWDFGDNTTSTTENPTHAYMAYGTIDVTLTVTTDFGCVDQITKQITLTEAPRADFSSLMLCDKDNTDFTNLSTEPSTAITNYEWTFSDGSTYNTKDVSRSFPSVGPYDVTLLAISDNGCTDEMTKTISVDEEPTAEFYADDVCEGADMEFLNASTGNMGNYTSSWDFGGGNTSMDADPVVSLPVGTHTVTLTVTTPSGCESDVTKTVTVKENPAITNITVESAEMGDGSMNIIATVTPNDVDYIVFWGDGGRAQGSTTTGQITETYSYLTDGKYPVTVRLSRQECIVEGNGVASVLRTGLINLNAGQLKAYPNPSNGKFNIDLSGLNEGPVTITVHASNGQVVNGNAVINGNSAQLDLSTEAAGVYLVTVVTDSGVYNARVTLNK